MCCVIQLPLFFRNMFPDLMAGSTIAAAITAVAAAITAIAAAITVVAAAIH